MIGKSVALMLVAISCASVAIAKLPPPPPDSEAKVAEAKEKAAAAAKVQGELLGKWQDIAVQKYKASQGASASTAKPAAKQ